MEHAPTQSPELFPALITAESLAAGADGRIARADAITAEVLEKAADPDIAPTYEDTVGALDNIWDELGWEGDAGRFEMLVAAVYPDVPVDDAAHARIEEETRELRERGEMDEAQALAAKLEQEHRAQIRTAGRGAQTRLQERWREVYFDKGLYNAVKAFSEREGLVADLGDEQKRALEHTLIRFRLAGQELNDAGREQLQALYARLDAIGPEFLKNVAEGTPTITLDEQAQADLPKALVDTLKPVDGGESGARPIDLNDANYYTISTQVSNRETREEAYRAFYSVGMPKNEKLIEEATGLRLRIARLLGYPSWTHMQTEGQMAGSLEAVQAFYDELAGPLHTKVQAEIAAMETLLVADGHEGPVQAYDIAYYERKLREQLGIDDKAIAEYLPLDAVLEGMFALSEDMFGMHCEETPNTGLWHEDVRAFRITNAETGATSTLLLDLFPRTGKRPGGATFTLQYGNRSATGEHHEPVIVIVANITAPGADGKPPLMNPNDLRAIFHEFGHVVQGQARTETVQFASDKTEFDFREAPSQMFQKLATLPGVIWWISKHREIGEQIPVHLIEKLTEVQQVTSGLNAMHLLRLSVFDTAVHGTSPVPTEDLADPAVMPIDVAAAYQLAETYSGTPSTAKVSWPARLRHLFIEPYPANQYGYLWSQVYAAEILAAFTGAGEDRVNIQEVGARYRDQILRHGGSKPADEMLRNFLGREPNQAAFRRSLGLVA